MIKYWKPILLNALVGGLIVFAVKELHNSWQYALPIMILVFAYVNYKSIAKEEEPNN